LQPRRHESQCGCLPGPGSHRDGSGPVDHAYLTLLDSGPRLTAAYTSASYASRAMCQGRPVGQHARSRSVMDVTSPPLANQPMTERTANASPGQRWQTLLRGRYNAARQV
jgi:hypothetical protein